MKRYRKKRTGGVVPFAAQVPNQVWTVDFIYDSCLSGTKLKILSVLDEFTREWLALAVSTSPEARDVQSALEPLMEPRGAPKSLRSDNGSEFIAYSLSVWLAMASTQSRFIAPGKPRQTASSSRFIPRFGVTFWMSNSSTN